MTKGLNFYWDFDDLEYEDKYAQREHERNVEGHFCLFAGWAMKTLIALNQGVYSKESIINESVEYAKLLTEELDHWYIEKGKVVRKEK